ncbi:DUF2911 domain-containing protein [Dyadobacter sp. CY323]|uniref:DUF2911 domain-containing protein n=1 Tax=Dyadobacter sp. CY323 TaxID=2907302 RepID=UPI001F41DEC6|nr:DUF2911 domain-containing protein [Dyadobacter sp. CY323]MCE6991038.1 DUF2911 domain-containing protein [Dyadobacter sp. CY323]
MKKKVIFNGLMLTLVGLFMTTFAFAQADKASRPSPPQTASGKVGGATVTINYSSPSVKGRKIFGDLVPYDKVWRAGANEATIFETDKDITVGGKKLPAGKYSLYAIPGANEWSFVFNSETGQWGIKRGGDTSKDASKDVLTVTAKPAKSASLNEKLAYEVTSTGFVLRWENTEVPVSIK